MQTRAIALLLVVVVIGCAVAPPVNPPATVRYVDIARYAGVWYQQASIPVYFQLNCTKTTATYSLNAKGNIRVKNTCVRNGELTTTIGEAVTTDRSNSKLMVKFPESFNIGSPYWIVRLAADYSYAVVSNPSYSLLWILYREKRMPQKLYNSIVADLKKDGFPVCSLKRTKQQ